MEEEHKRHVYESEETRPVVVEEGAEGAGELETKDGGLFDHFGKKDDHKKVEETEVNVSDEFKEKLQVSQDTPQHEQKPSLLEKLHRSGSRSSSSSDEEEGEEGEKKKKKKEKEKKKKEEKVEKDEHNEEEKKGFIEKIKEKLPGAKKTTDHDQDVPPSDHEAAEGEGKEKKGLLDKIKEKLPGYNHAKTTTDLHQDK